MKILYVDNHFCETLDLNLRMLIKLCPANPTKIEEGSTFEIKNISVILAGDPGLQLLKTTLVQRKLCF